MELTQEEIKDKLSEPMEYKWRVQSYSKSQPTAICVAYVDSRDVQNRLDNVLGVEGWQCDYKEVKGNLFCGIGVNFDGIWVWKWDCGTESKEDAEKGEASDSFKRAAVKWGIGRFLYSLGIEYLPANEIKNNNNFPYPVDQNGKRVSDVTKEINKKKKSTYEPKVAVKDKPRVIIGSEPFYRMMQAIEDGNGDKVKKSMNLYTFSKDALIMINNKLEEVEDGK
jgi:hypothetical protein